MSYPHCFPSHKHHQEWLSLARESNEVCSICTDCTAAYEKKMKLKGRCFSGFWKDLEVNSRAGSSEKRSTPSESVESGIRLARVRKAAGDRAREVLSGNTDSVQGGGGL